MPLVVKNLDKLIARMSQLASAVQPADVTIYLPGDVTDKLEWLKGGRRDFTADSSRLQSEMAETFSSKLEEALKKPDLKWSDIRECYVWVGLTYVSRIMDRVYSRGADVSGRIRKNAPSTVAKKGFDRPGYDTGELYRDLRAASARKADVKVTPRPNATQVTIRIAGM